MDKPTLTQASCRSYIETRLFEPVSMVTTNTLPGKADFTGVELELFPYRYDSNKAGGRAPVRLFGSECALTNVLADVSRSFGGVAKYWQPVNLPKRYTTQIEKIEFPNKDRFLFEPGGQVEISTAPCDSLKELEVHLLFMQKILANVSQQNNIHFAQTGTNPWFTVDEIRNQLHKPRYKALENYFDGIGPYGKQMMLQTGSLHINKDLGTDVTTHVKRIVAANLLVPFVTAIFANSSRIAGRATGHKAYRSFIWQHSDPARTGILPAHRMYQSLDKDDFIDAYLDFVLKAPLIYINELIDRVLPREYTFGYWLQNPIEGISPALSHLENHISLLFPEVRVKGYLELRSVDAPPAEWQMVPVCFYAGLFSNDQQLDKTLDLLLPYAAQSSVLLKAATFGMESDDIYHTSNKLMELAMDGFSSLPAHVKTEDQQCKLISFYERFILRRISFADIYIPGFPYL